MHNALLAFDPARRADIKAGIRRCTIEISEEVRGILGFRNNTLLVFPTTEPVCQKIIDGDDKAFAAAALAHRPVRVGTYPGQGYRIHVAPDLGHLTTSARILIVGHSGHGLPFALTLF